MGLQEEALPTSPTAIQAAVRLLADDDDNVALACRRQLLQWGSASRIALEEAACNHDPRVRVRARAILRSLELRDWTAKFLGYADRVHLDIERSRLHDLTSDDTFARSALLEEGVLLIASFGRRERVADACIGRQLSTFVREAKPLVEGRTSLTAGRNLANYLAGQLGFRGAEGRYYRPRHVFFDEVLNRRAGLPASLAALYMIVGRRVGLAVSAVRMPEYFLVRVHGQRPVLLDPFHSGRSVTKADCVRFLRETGAGEASFAQLRDVDDVAVLLGFLSDLVRVYDRREESEFRQALERAQRALQAIR